VIHCLSNSASSHSFVSRSPVATSRAQFSQRSRPASVHICDLAASVGKEMGLTGNFGMGAKVASLPSNPPQFRNTRLLCGGGRDSDQDTRDREK
jgi:hypothetical protein